MYSEQEKRAFYKTYNEEVNYKQMTAPLYEKMKGYHDVHKMQYIDIHTWLRDDILVKADKMTMAHSLELRVPFLDRDVFNVAKTIDPLMNVSNHTTKVCIKKGDGRGRS
jgi:asparagine synthase (glutamine-hydrolysing)